MAEKGIKRVFQRNFPYGEGFKEHKNFEAIQNKVRSGELFPAIRENNMDFYCSGQRALKKTKDRLRSNDYFLQERKEGQEGKELSFMHFPYHSKKEKIDVSMDNLLAKCETNGRRSNPEGLQLSKLFKNFSFASSTCGAIKLIDVEARFSSVQDEAGARAADKVDLVFQLEDNRLLFVEGKRRKDSRIRTKTTVPEVVGQVQDYKDQLEMRSDQILKAYAQVAKDMEVVFGSSFPQPTGIVPHVPILVVDDPVDKSVDVPCAKASGKAQDIWLEPHLTEGKPKVWNNAGVYLINGIEHFSEGIVDKDFTTLIQHVVDCIDKQAPQCK